ncbi:MAG: hypothetical protein J1F35_08090 [Erysipelotrichales bacterium]|nr:hypothetical protein [Erysipelotrichales bacterium]
MKTLKDFLNEKLEEYTDPDTGETFMIERPDTDLGREIANAAKDSDQEKMGELFELNRKYAELDQKRWNILDNIKDLQMRYNDLMNDMEDDLGEIISKGDNPEDKAQEYGKQMNDIDKEIEKLKKEIYNIDNQKAKIKTEIDKKL